MEWVTTTQVLEDLKGSNEAFAWNRFRDHFYPIILKFAKKLGLPQSYAEDAAQETMLTFLKAFRAGRYNKEKGRLSSWVFGVTRRVIFNFRKRLPREHIISDDTAGTPFWNMIEDEKAIKHTWESEWQKHVLEKCLLKAYSEFNGKVFEAFKLYALELKPVEEVCQALDMSSNAVYIAKSRVLSRLRQLQQDIEVEAEGAAS